MMLNVCSDRPRLPDERIARIVLFKLVINTKERDMKLYQLTSLISSHGTLAAGITLNAEK